MAFAQATNNNFQPGLIPNSTPSELLPEDLRVHPRVLADFDHASAKKLMSVHVYIKALTYDETVTDVTLNETSRPQDTTFFTYANRYSGGLASDCIEYNVINKDGIKGRITRGTCPYHSVYKINSFNCRGAHAGSLKQIRQLPLDAFWDALEPISYANASEGFNGDFLLVPTIMSSALAPKVTGNIKFDVHVTTKWRLYGAKGPSCN